MSSIRWKKFFTDSGLPAEVCENYAVVFSENRIRFDMLEELNKEILYDMGIKKLGDVISILRQAKVVHSNSYREKMFATDESKDSTRQDNSTYTKADSTISSNNLKKSSSEANTRRIVLPQQAKQKESMTRMVINKESTTKVSNDTPVRMIRKTALPVSAKETVIIRNVGGIHTTGRNVTGLDSVGLPASRKRVQPPNDESVDFVAKVVKSDMNSNPTVRNRIEAQSRLSNFSKEIQKVISSNGPSRVPVSLNSAQLSSNLPSQTSIKARLTLNKADSTTFPVNQSLSLKRNINVKSRLGNNPSTTTSNTVKGNYKIFWSFKCNFNIFCCLDRLGQKSVFSRVSLQNSNQKSSSVFQRLGA